MPPIVFANDQIFVPSSVLGHCKSVASMAKVTGMMKAVHAFSNCGRLLRRRRSPMAMANMVTKMYSAASLGFGQSASEHENATARVYFVSTQSESVAN